MTNVVGIFMFDAPVERRGHRADLVQFGETLDFDGNVIHGLISTLELLALLNLCSISV